MVPFSFAPKTNGLRLIEMTHTPSRYSLWFCAECAAVLTSDTTKPKHKHEALNECGWFERQ